MIRIVGYDKLNKGKDGLRFAWKVEGVSHYTESASFINRSKGKEEDICGYTTSVSMGCVLQKKKLQCAFCKTGNILPFERILTYKDIVKQNVFMVLVDLLCSEHPELKNKKREFAYMGQGEPGFSYEQVRLAIELTNAIMRGMGQKVYRHVFATCGVPAAIRSYISDLQSFFSERVTLHLSLHSTDRRSDLMPINNIYPYQDSIKELNKVFDISGEKPCVGILLFNNFIPPKNHIPYSSSIQEVVSILKKLNPAKCRISFCEFNPIPGICDGGIYNSDQAKEVLKIAIELGFEAKLFSSFGQEESSACGTLGGKEPNFRASEKWLELETEVDKLIKQYDLNGGY